MTSKKIRKLMGAIAMSILIALLVAGLAYTFPIDFALLGAVDLSIYVDALVGVYVIANVVKLRSLAQFIRARLGRTIRRLGARRKRTHAIGQQRRPADAHNDNDDPAAVPLAA
jgi:hypothetical protein